MSCPVIEVLFAFRLFGLLLQREKNWVAVDLLGSVKIKLIEQVLRSWGDIFPFLCWFGMGRIGMLRVPCQPGGVLKDLASPDILRKPQSILGGFFSLQLSESSLFLGSGGSRTWETAQGAE